jgi:hypothetical protein
MASAPQGPPVVKVVVALIVTLIVGALGAVGGCFAFFLGISGGGAAVGLAVVMVLLGMAALWIWWMVRFLK